ncbi:A/G-specific adenine glycosylase [Meiothermus rufus]|uniref:A/G-specific adenine glycosylase n=1 Tax=Meiothermus rufus TaxID=604332 RepID=UPI000405802F|nr:A/G-specific adenine glycosylase [Meiothermus rufus]
MAPTLQEALLAWYTQHQRRLPWREAADPYRVLLAEVLLQQTRVAQAIPYYQRFLERFPTLEALAQASLEEVLEVWQGCGYYARARHLHQLARQVVARGQPLPHTASGLQALPGVGPYTAAAVASIAFGQAIAAVDGNVRRVLARLQAWEHPRPKQVQAQAQALLDALKGQVHPGIWNQALMELGATVCTPRKPNCPGCPLVTFCRGQGQPERYPAARPRPQRSLEVVALVLQGPLGFHLEPRQGRWLGGLWGVPLEEEPGGLARLLARFGLQKAELLGTLRHDLTHRRLWVRVYRAWGEGRENPAERPLSRLDRKILALATAPAAGAARPPWPPS